MTPGTLGSRIKEAADRVGGLDRLAELIPSMSRRSLSDYVNEKTDPRASLIREIAVATGAAAGWIIAGETGVVANNGSMVRLPRFDIQASAGPGMVPLGEAAEFVVAFDRQFLRDRGAVPERCSVIETRGDSMQPTIPDGSLLIVDHSQTDVSGGAIYVIGVSDTVLVKRVRLRFDGSVELASDNTAYAPEIINRDQLADLRVIGKVVYYCRTP